MKDKVVECDEVSAWSHYSNPRSFQYVGWSDGRFIIEVRKKVGRRRELDEYPTEEEVKLVKEAVKQEIEFAKTNPDKTPPRNRDKMGLTDKDKMDQQLLNSLGKLR